jgi:hypothetical protein
MATHWVKTTRSIWWAAAGLVASHQTRWVGLVTKLLQQTGESWKEEATGAIGCSDRSLPKSLSISVMRVQLTIAIQAMEERTRHSELDQEFAFCPHRSVAGC